MITCIERGDSRYPAILQDRLGDDAPFCLYVMGDASILHQRLLGLLCSIQCPGSIVIKTLDAIRMLRDRNVAMIGGFHSPMEKECLDILLRGSQPVILCAARGLAGLRMGRTWRRAVEEGRLLVLSPFAEKTRRTTAVQAAQRNSLVAALADAMWVPHAVPGGKTWAIVRSALARKQPVFTFDDEANETIREIGARPFPEFMETPGNIPGGVDAMNAE